MAKLFGSQIGGSGTEVSSMFGGPYHYQQEFVITKKILKVLPHLQTQQQTLNKMEKKLEKLGVEDEKDLKWITEEDLLEDQLLTRISARKLVKSWKSIRATSGL